MQFGTGKGHMNTIWHKKMPQEYNLAQEEATMNALLPQVKICTECNLPQGKGHKECNLPE